MLHKQITIILASVLGAIVVCDAETALLVIDDATSPDGKYILEMTDAGGDKGGRVEIKTLPARKVVGRISDSDYQGEGIRYTLDAVWNENSTAVALNVSEGRNITFCRVFAESGGVWKEAALPEKVIDRVRRKANTAEGKTQDYLSAEKWISPKKLRLHLQGNSGEVYEIICRLVPGDKPRLALVETIAPKAEAEPEPQSVEPKDEYEDYVFTVLAGGNRGSKDGRGLEAQFRMPKGVAVDAADNVFVADSGNHLIRKITADGTVSTVAGLAEQSGNVDGVGAAARFWTPEHLAIDATGNIYVVDSRGDGLLADAAIRKVTPSGAVSTLVDSKALAARTPRHDEVADEPSAVAVDKNGIFYVAMEGDRIIRKITPDRAVTTLAGLAGTSGMVDGPGKSARFIQPKGLAADAKGNQYVADTSAVRKIDPSGVVTTLVRSAAQFVDLRGVAVDSAGNIYGLDSANQTVRKIALGGVVKTLRDVHNQSPFDLPVAIAVDDKGWVYVANVDNASIVVGKPAK